MKIKYLLVPVAAMFLVGWRSAPQVKTDVATVIAAPEDFDRKRVEITASVADNPIPVGSYFKRWSPTVDSSGQELTAYEKGFNPATIMKAYHLVEKARRGGDEVVLVGKVRMSQTKTGERIVKLQLDSVKYGSTTVRTDVGPFVDETNSEGFPWTPLWYDGIKYYPGEFPY